MSRSTIADASMKPFDENPALGSRLMAYASEQLLQAQTHLAQEGEARHSGIHEARKCIRRARATLALGVSVFDQRAKRLDDELGRLCGGLSPLRDAQALIEALQRLGNLAPSALRAILPRAELAARKRRDQMLERALKRDPQFNSRRQRLLAAQVRLLRLQWQVVNATDVSKAITRSKRRTDKAQRRIKRHIDDDNAWHTFRRRLRRLRHQGLLLAELQPDLRQGIKCLEHKARTLGESQDDALLLSHCGRRSPFPPDQRKLLRDIARERLQRTRSTWGMTMIEIELRIERMDPLFNKLDPAPFHAKALDRNADACLLKSAEEHGARQSLTIAIHGPTPPGHHLADITSAIHTHLAPAQGPAGSHPCVAQQARFP